MKEFVDDDRRASIEFYDIQDSITEDNIDSTIERLKKLIKKDSTYLDPYLLLSELYEITGKKKKSDEIVQKAFDKAIQMITDENGQWPDKLEWGWLENRHIIRTLINMGILYWQKNKTLEAYCLFQKLLETNPNDNGGVRYFMLAILEKMSEKSFYKLFDKGRYWDNEIDGWFSKKVKKHNEEFSKWIELDQ